jgi:glyoxylase-like metal-dependent hydrolase (beta-lactamase superfamily II)
MDARDGGGFLRRRGLRRAVRLGMVVLTIAVLLGLITVWRAPEVQAWWWRAHAGLPAMNPGKVTLTQNLRWFDDYYVVADLGEGAYAIGEPLYGQCNFSYLLTGTERALLFDTGPGVRDIAPVVHSLTTLPLVVLPSHLHFDHTGNLHRFDTVALPDLPPLRRQVHDGQFTMGFYQFLGFVEGFKRRPIKVSQWLTPGSVIDLGNRQLTLISVPGHTPESVVLFDREANRLFAGDFIYPSEIYAFLPGANLADYAASARRVATIVNDKTQIHGAHGCDRLPNVDIPTLGLADVEALQKALAMAAFSNGRLGAGWFPRVVPVNGRMRLFATYTWMAR